MPDAKVIPFPGLQVGDEVEFRHDGKGPFTIKSFLELRSGARHVCLVNDQGNELWTTPESIVSIYDLRETDPEMLCWSCMERPRSFAEWTCGMCKECARAT